MQATDVFYTSLLEKNKIAFDAGIRRIVNAGGTSSSKTYSILQLLLIIALERKKPTSIHVCSETLPHLKLGAIRDFETILKGAGLYNEKNINKTDLKYHFGSNYIQFFSADSPGKVTGPRRDILYINECCNIPYNIVSEMEMRTSECIFYDFNPVADFWISEKVLNLPSNEFELIKSNYLDNEMLPESITRDIELKAARDPNFKKIHIDVEFGTYEGLIFTKFNLVDEMPPTLREVYGLDFGFTNDPTAIVDVRFNNGELWFDEMIYRTQMTNQDIIQFYKTIDNKKIIADSSEPKSIEEIRRSGINIEGAIKGSDSIRRGIDLMQSYPINVTKRSINLIKELRGYKWAVDRAGKQFNTPIEINNHCIDAARYGVTKLVGKPEMKAISVAW